MSISEAAIKDLAKSYGFELVGLAAALPAGDFTRFDRWRYDGMAGEMGYLTDRRGDMRRDPRTLLPSAQTILCVGKLYNTGHPYSTQSKRTGSGWIARYAWSDDYHNTLQADLRRLVEGIQARHPEPFDWKVCVDTAPLLERTYARLAGLGWIGKNTCLINQEQGSWFFLGELLLSIRLQPDIPVPDRCGSCTRCIDACPTEALVPDSEGRFRVDSRTCISYLTIEKRGISSLGEQAAVGRHVFGCDICQDVCPWNREAPATDDVRFSPRLSTIAPSLDDLSRSTEEEFAHTFRHTPLWRTKYSGFLRNVALAAAHEEPAVAMPILERLTTHHDLIVSETARKSLVQVQEGTRRCE